MPPLFLPPCTLPRLARPSPPPPPSHRPLRAILSSRRTVAPPPSSPRPPPPSSLRVVFCDIDGTTLASDNTIADSTIASIAALPYPSVRWIPATGKSRAGCVASLGSLAPILADRYPGGVPGVYLQGLVVYGEDGRLIYDNSLPEDVCLDVVGLSRELGIDLIAYARDGDAILCEVATVATDRVVEYHEPVPEEVGSWESVIGVDRIMKFIFMASDERIASVRPAIEDAVRGRGEVTKATEGMLEVLPRGASKAAGVRLMREELGVGAEECFAIGDGENDEGMLREAGVSVAVANAVPIAAAAAMFRAKSNDEGGLSEALERFVMRGRT